MTTKRREHRRSRHATRLARESIAHAGTPTNVGKALDRATSTVCHEAKDRENPVLRDAFALLVRLNAHPDVSGRAFAERVTEAVDLAEITEADTDTLIARGLWLMPEENASDSVEDNASYLDPHTHAEALRKHASIASELAAILDELDYRGVNLHALYASKVAA